MCTLNLGALELDHEATAGFDQLVWFDAEHVMPCAGRRPHLGVLQQVGIDEHAQLSGMAERRHAIVGFGNRSVSSIAYPRFGGP